LWPSGTPASHPEPLFDVGVLGLLVGVEGFGVVGCVEGAVVGFLLGTELELGADDELDVVELPVGAGAELLLGTDVGVGAGALDVDDEVAGDDVVDEPTPAAACCTASELVPPEFDEHPVMPSATAPATAMKAPPFPAPEVLMPLSTPERRVELRRRRSENPLVIEAAIETAHQPSPTTGLPVK
jgi:hypothetical protein